MSLLFAVPPTGRDYRGATDVFEPLRDLARQRRSQFPDAGAPIRRAADVHETPREVSQVGRPR